MVIELKNWISQRSKQARFEASLKPHLPHLYQLAFRFSGNRDDAEDLVQELLLKLYKNPAQIDSIDNLRPWLARVLYHLFIDQKRRESRSAIHLAIDNGADASGDGQELREQLTSYEENLEKTPTPERLNEQEQRLQQLQAALDQLSEEHRSVIMLHDVEGYAMQEMQEILDCPIGTIKSRLHRARANLQQLLSKGIS